MWVFKSSTEIIKKYARHLDMIESAHHPFSLNAIIKGFKRITAKIKIKPKTSAILQRLYFIIIDSFWLLEKKLPSKIAKNPTYTVHV